MSPCNNPVSPLLGCTLDELNLCLDDNKTNNESSLQINSESVRGEDDKLIRMIQNINQQNKDELQSFAQLIGSKL